MLRGVDKPLFRKSIAEPLNDISTIIHEEMCTKDIVNENVMSNKSVPKSSVKVVPTIETNLALIS